MKDRPLSYGRIAARMTFLVLLLLVLAAPQLMSNRPGPGFAEAKSLLEAVPLATWVIVGVVALGILGVWHVIRPRAAKAPAQGTPAASSTVQTMQIDEAVSKAKGGNSLASAQFPLILLQRVAGWLHVEEGKECFILEGKQVIRRTRFYFAPMRFLGKPITARRVLLSPEPLKDLSAKALTRELDEHLKYELTLIVSVAYRVTAPEHVARLTDPIGEVTERIRGAVVEYIHSESLGRIVSDDGTLRRELKRQLEAAPSIRGYYEIIDVLSALPTGDERINEIIRKTREAFDSKELVKAEGELGRIKADYEIQIARTRAELEDEFKGREHDRVMEMQRLGHEATTLQALIGMVAQVASAGVNPAGALTEISRLVRSSTFVSGNEPVQGTLPPGEAVLATEQRLLDEFKSQLGITSVSVTPNQRNPDRPGQARLEFPEFSLLIDCPDGYPVVPPVVHLERDDGVNSEMSVPWHANSHLTEVAVAAKMQVQAKLDRRSE